MLNRKTVPAFGVGLILVVASAFGQTASTTATYTTSSTLAPVGLAPSETAQVNVVNTAGATVTAVATLGTPMAAPSCTGSIAFLDAKGATIGTAKSFTVGSGHVFSATLPYASAGGSGARVVIRAQITSTMTLGAVFTTTDPVTGPALPAMPVVPACALQSSFETYDTATGVTHVFLPGPTATPFLTPASRSGNFTAMLPN